MAHTANSAPLRAAVQRKHSCWYSRKTSPSTARMGTRTHMVVTPRLSFENIVIISPDSARNSPMLPRYAIGARSLRSARLT